MSLQAQPQANYLRANLFLGLSSAASLALTLTPALLRYCGCENWLGPAFSNTLALGAEGALPDRGWFRFLRMLDNPTALLILAFLAVAEVLLLGPQLAGEFAIPSVPELDGKKLAVWVVAWFQGLLQTLKNLSIGSHALSVCVNIWRGAICLGLPWFFARIIIYNQYHTPGALVQLLCGGLALFTLVLCGQASLKSIKIAVKEAIRKVVTF